MSVSRPAIPMFIPLTWLASKWRFLLAIPIVACVWGLGRVAGDAVPAVAQGLEWLSQCVPDDAPWLVFFMLFVLVRLATLPFQLCHPRRTAGGTWQSWMEGGAFTPRVYVLGVLVYIADAVALGLAVQAAPMFAERLDIQAREWPLSWVGDSIPSFLLGTGVIFGIAIALQACLLSVWSGLAGKVKGRIDWWPHPAAAGLGWRHYLGLVVVQDWLLYVPSIVVLRLELPQAPALLSICVGLIAARLAVTTLAFVLSCVIGAAQPDRGQRSGALACGLLVLAPFALGGWQAYRERTFNRAALETMVRELQSPEAAQRLAGLGDAVMLRRHAYIASVLKSADTTDRLAALQWLGMRGDGADSFASMIISTALDEDRAVRTNALHLIEARARYWPHEGPVRVAMEMLQTVAEQPGPHQMGAVAALAYLGSIPPNVAVENSLGMKFAFVPIVGGTTNGQVILFSIWDTRNEDYKIFVRETGRSYDPPAFPQTSTDPVVNVSWEDANAFCAWLSKKEGCNYRLPSDHEWSCAVGIGDRERADNTPKGKDGMVIGVYPWGTQWPPPKGAGNYSPDLKLDEFEYTSPVGSFGANQYGLFDMAGNVWQWCEDWYDSNDTFRVLRGGSWVNGMEFNLRSSSRNYDRPAQRNIYNGFRCVLEISDGELPGKRLP